MSDALTCSDCLLERTGFEPSRPLHFVLVPRLGGHFGIHERIAVTKKLRSLPTVRIQLPPAASLVFERLSVEPPKIAALVRFLPVQGHRRTCQCRLPARFLGNFSLLLGDPGR
jgi:hypothetical protein